MLSISDIRGQAGVILGQPEINLLGIDLWQRNFMREIPDQSLIYCWGQRLYT